MLDDFVFKFGFQFIVFYCHLMLEIFNAVAEELGSLKPFPSLHKKGCNNERQRERERISSWSIAVEIVANGHWFCEYQEWKLVICNALENLEKT